MKIKIKKQVQNIRMMRNVWVQYVERKLVNKKKEKISMLLVKRKGSVDKRKKKKSTIFSLSDCCKRIGNKENKKKEKSTWGNTNST